jgi:hypothetical protein
LNCLPSGIYGYWRAAVLIDNNSKNQKADNEDTNNTLSFTASEYESLYRVFKILKKARDKTNASKSPDWITLESYQATMKNKNQ